MSAEVIQSDDPAEIAAIVIALRLLTASTHPGCSVPSSARPGQAAMVASWVLSASPGARSWRSTRTMEKHHSDVAL
jgi:hypothetical protein